MVISPYFLTWLGSENPSLNWSEAVAEFPEIDGEINEKTFDFLLEKLSIPLPEV